MSDQFINLTCNNLFDEHLCCAIADKKHQQGVAAKREWLKDRLAEGHVFRKLNDKAKVFIEYAPLETAWVPLKGTQYIYIYCLWVSGRFKGKGYGKYLLNYCMNDARSQNKAGVCVLSSKKKKPYLSDKKFFQNYGFEVIDSVGDYELLAVSFNNTKPSFTDKVKQQHIKNKALTIYYTKQCPYVPNCIEQVSSYCESKGILLTLKEVDTLKKAKEVPCVFNNWAVFLNGEFQTIQLLNEGGLKKLLA